jgi:hypothetical protein
MVHFLIDLLFALIMMEQMMKILLVEDMFVVQKENLLEMM